VSEKGVTQIVEKEVHQLPPNAEISITQSVVMKETTYQMQTKSKLSTVLKEFCQNRNKNK
jgi:hypothetical protein